MTQRLHKVLFDGTHNQFSNLSLNLNAAAASTNPAWPAYAEACVETYELYPHLAANGTSYQSWVLRGTIRCCCAPPCGYQSDHASNAYSKVASVSTSPVQQPDTQHGPAQGYVESMLAANDLQALASQAQTAVATAAASVALGATLATDATTFDLAASEIEAHLGIVGTDTNGLLSVAGATVLVLAGTSTVANDYFVVAAFLKLYQRLIGAVYSRLSKDWPQRGTAKPLTLGPRQASSASTAAATATTSTSAAPTTATPVSTAAATPAATSATTTTSPAATAA